MRQKINPPLLTRSQPPPIKTEPKPPPPSRGQVWRQRARRLRERSHGVTQIGVGILIALAALFAYDVIHPGETRLSPRDVKVLVAQAMASATPPPSFASRVYDIIAPSVVQIKTSTLTVDGKTESGSGSGVILDQSGAILTALHVVKDAIDIQVLFFDNTTSQASIIGQEPDNDIALLRPRDLPSQVIPATLGSPGALNIGDEAFVVGNPFGLRHTLTAGVISGLGRSLKSSKTGSALSNLIQVDAAVNPGNSGGPLLNRDGEVVGIITSLLNPTDQEVFIGIGFAVPIDVAGGVGGPPPY
ncbi:MAG: trypsin-like peptidase domain-containing protein [Chloroflexota bacterium]|nr:trypsin-like peptidase domain-containing protein [Chloroflexota bacterium]